MTHLKPRPNDRNISINATLLGATSVQCVWPPCCDVLLHVATCWVFLAQIWKWSNFSCNICACCMMLWSFSQVRATMLCLGMRTNSILNSQHVATRCNRVAKRVQHVPTMLRSVAFKCCDRLPGACKCWANNVGMCCVETLLSFGRGFRILIYRPWAIRVPWKCGKVLMASVNRRHYSPAEIFTQLFDLKNSAFMT